jgi:hypothetical protein
MSGSFDYFRKIQRKLGSRLLNACFLDLCGSEANFSFFSSHKTKMQSIFTNQKLTGRLGFS